MGSETAAAIRKVRREACITDNPSTRPGVAEKISKTMSQYLQENPDVRRGENNPFYGKQHSEEQKQKWSDQKKGKVAWTPEQREKHFKHVGRGETHNNWQGGISNGEYDFGFSDKLKQELKEECEYVCQLCFEKKENLSIHHIDYDKQNSSRENLIPLCNSCHSKTNYRREHWTQFFKKRK